VQCSRAVMVIQSLQMCNGYGGWNSHLTAAAMWRQDT
jgi:hypothetical protein